MKIVTSLNIKDFLLKPKVLLNFSFGPEIFFPFLIYMAGYTMHFTSRASKPVPVLLSPVIPLVFVIGFLIVLSLAISAAAGMIIRDRAGGPGGGNAYRWAVKAIMVMGMALPAAGMAAYRHWPMAGLIAFASSLIVFYCFSSAVPSRLFLASLLRYFLQVFLPFLWGWVLLGGGKLFLLNVASPEFWGMSLVFGLIYWEAEIPPPLEKKARLRGGVVIARIIFFSLPYLLLAGGVKMNVFKTGNPFRLIGGAIILYALWFAAEAALTFYPENKLSIFLDRVSGGRIGRIFLVLSAGVMIFGYYSVRLSLQF